MTGSGVPPDSSTAANEFSANMARTNLPQKESSLPRAARAETRAFEGVQLAGRVWVSASLPAEGRRACGSHHLVDLKQIVEEHLKPANGKVRISWWPTEGTESTGGQQRGLRQTVAI